MGPLIPILANAGMQAANMVMQGSMNKKQMQFSKDMYAQQRKDALADWTMQNEYNSPQSQMQRLRDANLNPNLVYGNGADAKAVGPVRQSSVESWKPTAPQLDINSLGNTMSQYADLKVKEATADNLKAQNSVILQDAILKAAQTASTVQGTEKSKFDLSQGQRLADISFEAAKAALRKTDADTVFTINQDERAAAQNSANLAEAAERILNSRSQRATNDVQRRQIQQQTINLKKDATLKQLDIDLKRLGIQPGDELWQRILGRIIGSPENLKENWKDIKEVMKNGIRGLSPQQDSIMRSLKSDSLYRKYRRY